MRCSRHHACYVLQHDPLRRIGYGRSNSFRFCNLGRKRYDVRSGSWLCKNADARRGRRNRFSGSNRSVASRESSKSSFVDWQGRKTSKHGDTSLSCTFSITAAMPRAKRSSRCQEKDSNDFCSVQVFTQPGSFSSRDNYPAEDAIRKLTWCQALTAVTMAAAIKILREASRQRDTSYSGRGRRGSRWRRSQTERCPEMIIRGGWRRPA